MEIQKTATEHALGHQAESSYMPLAAQLCSIPELKIDQLVQEPDEIYSAELIFDDEKRIRGLWHSETEIKTFENGEELVTRHRGYEFFAQESIYQGIPTLEFDDVVGLEHLVSEDHIAIDFTNISRHPNRAIGYVYEPDKGWAIVVDSDLALGEWRGEVNLIRYFPRIAREAKQLPHAFNIIYDTEYEPALPWLKVWFRVPKGTCIVTFAEECIGQLESVFLRYEALRVHDAGHDLFDGTLLISRNEGLTLDYGRILSAISCLPKASRKKDWPALGCGLLVTAMWLAMTTTTILIEKLIDL